MYQRAHRQMNFLERNRISKFIIVVKESRRRSDNDDQPHIGKYRLLKTIGKDNFSKGNGSNPAIIVGILGLRYPYIRVQRTGLNQVTVKLARHVFTNLEVAIKVIDKKTMSRTSLNKLFRSSKY